MFAIEFAPEAEQDLECFKKSDQKVITAGIEKQLLNQPEAETRNRKRLRPGHLTEWELRVRTMRVFYEVAAEANLVTIVAIGYKEGNKLLFRGQEYQP